jgi:hypothetical protein
MLFTAQPTETDAQWLVYDAAVDGDLLAGLPALQTQVATSTAASATAVTSNATANQVIMAANQATQIAHELLELRGFVTNLQRITSARGLQSTIARNNLGQSLSQGTQLAETLVNAQPNDGSGVLTTADLSDLEGEFQKFAVGGLSGQGVNLDGIVAMVTGQKETTNLQAAIELQHETGVLNAQFLQAQILDIGSSLECLGCSGGFQAPGIRDYSQAILGKSPGSVL